MISLITGGAGFIGSHLAERLIAAGDDVIVYDNLATGRCGNLERIRHAPGFRFIEGDIRDQSALERAVEGCDEVYHLAAAVGVRLILERPLEAMLVNLRGTENVLDAASRHGARLLFTSSSEVYGSATEGRMDEEGPRTYGSTTTSRWAYAGAKAMGESLALAYHRERGLGATIVRLFNVAGPRQLDTYGMVLPRFVRQAVAGEPITIYGDGEQRRSFLHVADAVDAIIRLMRTPEAIGGIFNLGSRESISIGALARLVAAAAGSRVPPVHIPYALAYPDGFAEIAKRTPELRRSEELIGFRPAHDLGSIIEDLIVEAGRGNAETPTWSDGRPDRGSESNMAVAIAGCRKSPNRLVKPGRGDMVISTRPTSVLSQRSIMHEPWHDGRSCFCAYPLLCGCLRR
jgi:UDP-glucose 4-epimerase